MQGRRSRLARDLPNRDKDHLKTYLHEDKGSSHELSSILIISRVFHSLTDITMDEIKTFASRFEDGRKEVPSPITTASPPVYEASEMGANVGNDISDMQRLGKKQEFKVLTLE